jgi:hypothetical protein
MVHEILRIYFPGVGVLVDEGVEVGLGEFGVVAFVVAMATVADHVDEYVGVEFLAETGGDLCAFDYGLDIVAVDV